MKVQPPAGLRSFKLSSFTLTQFKKMKKETVRVTFLIVRRIFRCGIKSEMRQRWPKNTAGRLHQQRGGRGAVYQIPLRRNLVFNWTPL